MREFTCPSGAILKINESPFAVAKALYQAVLREIKGVEITSKTEISTIIKQVVCIGFSSLEVEKCLTECMKRCTYNAGGGDLKIDDQTFEPSSAREDYMSVCIEVAKENLSPFTKSLFAEYQRISAMMEPTPA